MPDSGRGWLPGDPAELWREVPGRLPLWSVRACELERATILMHPRNPADGKPRVLPFRCHNYRCRRCSRAVAYGDFVRVEAGAVSRSRWLYAVLTFNPADHATPWAAYKSAGELWDKRLRRQLERCYGRVEYIQTFERHRSGWPHVNVLLRSDALLEAVDAAGVERRPVDPRNPRVCRVANFPRWRPWLAQHAPACGFGQRVWVEVVDNTAAMAAYLTKVAGELCRAYLKAGDQRPIGAPRHWRRIRASRGLLPPRPKGDPEWTGILATRAPSNYADPVTGEQVATWEDVEAAELAAWARRTGESAERWRRAFAAGPSSERATPVDIDARGRTFQAGDVEAP